jgi:Protein of unknown function (DUF2637)
MIGTDKAIRWSTAGAVIGVAVVAVAVSYEHAYALVHAHGETGWTPHLIPLTVDGLIWASSMVMLDSARRGVPVPTLARWLLGLGIAATLAANVARDLGLRSLLDVPRLHVGPVRQAGGSQVLGSEPLRGLKLGADRPGRLLLGPQVQSETVDHRLERAGIKVALVASADPLAERFPDIEPPLSGGSVSAVRSERLPHHGSVGCVSAGQRLCGQGRGRTADLPLFSSKDGRTPESAPGHPASTAALREPRRTSAYTRE